MTLLQYRLPTLQDEAALKAYVQEHYDYGETSVSASHGLPALEYSEWLRQVHAGAETGSPEMGKSLLCVCCAGDQIVGLLSIRYGISGEMLKKYGHIGYGVRPSERRKGYARQMLRFALDVCKEHGLREVLLGCMKDNLASAAVIRKSGGILIAENENYKPGKIAQYYRISV